MSGESNWDRLFGGSGQMNRAERRYAQRDVARMVRRANRAADRAAKAEKTKEVERGRSED